MIRPIFSEFKKYTGPIRPLVDFLLSPVPGLNDLSQMLGGPQLTFVTLGMLGGARSEATMAAARRAQQVLGLLQEIFVMADSLDEVIRDGQAIVINFGDFWITGQPVVKPNESPTQLNAIEYRLNFNPRTGTHVRVFNNGTEVPSSQYRIVRYKDGNANRTKIVFNTAPTGPITATYTTTDGGSTDLTKKDTPVQSSRTRYQPSLRLILMVAYPQVCTTRLRVRAKPVRQDAIGSQQTRWSQRCQWQRRLWYQDSTAVRSFEHFQTVHGRESGHHSVGYPAF